VYESNGVVVTAFPVPHGMYGAVGYRLDYAGMSMVYAGAAYPYARPEGGMGGSFAENTRWRHFAVAAAVSLVVLAGARDWHAWLCLPLVACAVWLMARRVACSLGGMTGDTYGALCEVTEVVALMAFGVAIP
ncbi:MAG: adenosylcobinamide-GDP ribazoletransferase, partial [Candidatus Poribacteria bacterium]